MTAESTTPNKRKINLWLIAGAVVILLAIGAAVFVTNRQSALAAETGTARRRDP